MAAISGVVSGKRKRQQVVIAQPLIATHATIVSSKPPPISLEALQNTGRYIEQLYSCDTAKGTHRERVHDSFLGAFIQEGTNALALVRHPAP